MNLNIEHRACYEFDAPVAYTIQQLHLTPQDGFGQRVKNWDIRVNGNLQSYTDAFGNATHTLVLDEPSNHMDLESIESLSKSLEEFPGAVIVTSHDQDLISRVATRILELRPDGSWWDFKGPYAEYQVALEAEKKAKKKSKV